MPSSVKRSQFGYRICWAQYFAKKLLTRNPQLPSYLLLFRFQRWRETNRYLSTPWLLVPMKWTLSGLRLLVLSFRVLVNMIQDECFLHGLYWWHSNLLWKYRTTCSTWGTVLTRLREINLKISREKSKFGLSSVKYLGFTITDKGILPVYQIIKTLYPTNSCHSLVDSSRRESFFCELEEFQT